MVKNSKIPQPLDDRDRHILALVQRDAKMSQAEIARRVGLSAAAVNERLKKLESAGVIRRFAALVDARAVGAPITAFIEVFIEHPRLEPGFIERVLKMDQVQECHHITGEFSLLLKVRVADMGALQRILIEQINACEGVRQTRTVMALSTLKEESYIPTDAKGETT